jgi:uncharacterized protein (DUF305 family)
MNRKPLIYGILGLLAGSAVTALAMLLPAKTSPQIATATPVAGRINLVESPTAILAQATSPVPFRPRRMGMGHSDSHFIVMMIPHHQGAIAMADLALSRSKRSEIKQLAQAIKTTQTQEIEQMRTWYKQWYGADVPSWQPGMGMGMGMMGNPNNGNPKQLRPNSRPGWGMGMGCRGMMGTDLSALQNAPDFDRAFIEEMIPHHQMGVMMAQMVINSQRPEMRHLAQSIVKNQTDEINQMQQWYQAWYK